MMPTGYTAAVADGTVTDLATFALQCARGMGALITMRDADSDAEIPERFEPSPWSAKKLAAAKAERIRLGALTEAEASAEAQAEFDRKTAAKVQYLSDKAKQRERYDVMIAKVQGWEGAPDGLKGFMLSQLQDSRRFDCPPDDRYYDEPQAMTGREWRDEKLAKAEKDILYHAAEDAKERERTEGRNAWVAQLRLALQGAS